MDLRGMCSRRLEKTA